MPLKTLAEAFVHFEAMISFRFADKWLAMALLILFGALALYALIVAWRHGRPGCRSALLAVTLAFLVIYFRSPDANYVQWRLNLFVFFGLLLWLGAFPYPRFILRGAQVIAAAIAIAFLVGNATRWAPLQDQIRAYVHAARNVPAGSTLLPLVFDRYGHDADGRRLSDVVEAFYTTSGYIVADRRIIDLHNYEAHTDHFPLLYRPDLDPYASISIQSVRQRDRPGDRSPRPPTSSSTKPAPAAPLITCSSGGRRRTSSSVMPPRIANALPVSSTSWTVSTRSNDPAASIPFSYGNAKLPPPPAPAATQPTTLPTPGASASH